jgi:hypothetical protein
VVKFDRIVKPGEVGFITLSLNLPSTLGRFVKRAIVKTNDPRPTRARFSLALTGEVVSESAGLEHKPDDNKVKTSAQKPTDNKTQN